MKKIRVIRYVADCGKRFSRKNACEKHEARCKCWTNPAFKTCLTCRFNRVIRDSNGMEGEPNLLQTWKANECQNPLFDYSQHHTQAHEKAPDLNINCPVWEPKD